MFFRSKYACLEFSQLKFLGELFVATLNNGVFEERHARLSEPSEIVTRQAPLSEPQYEPLCNIYPPLQQDLNRARHQNRNQNTLEVTMCASNGDFFVTLCGVVLKVFLFRQHQMLVCTVC